MAKGKKKTKFIPLDQIGKIENIPKPEKKENNEIVKKSETSTPSTPKSPSTPKNTPKNNKEKKEKVIKDEKEDFSSCIICTEDVELYAVGSCNHPICHKCSLKLRLLYKTKECPYCKVHIKQII